MQYDYEKLLTKIKERYKSQKKLAEEMGISERSLSLKLNNKVGFKQGEINKMCVLLKINKIQISYYFFNLKD